MFEQLGYDIEPNVDDFIFYDRYICYSKNYETNNCRYIYFDFEDKDWCIDTKEDMVYIDMRLLKAIYKQCEELGWL